MRLDLYGGRAVVAAAVFCVAVVQVTSLSVAQSGADAANEPQDTAMAILRPDEYGWRLFVALNWPADVANKTADAAKPFGADGPVVWETWRNVNHLAPDTMFKPDGSDPGPWIQPPGPVVASARTDAAKRFEAVPLKQRFVLAQRAVRRALAAGRNIAQPAFDAQVRTSNEVRMSKSAYEFVRAETLYNREGQIAKVEAGHLNLDFPLNAKLVKAQWRPIKDSDKPRYHWAEVTRDGQRELWGLTALHVTTKDLPNWYWATFEHIDNKQAGPTGDPDTPNAGWHTQSVDRFACPPPEKPDCERVPAGLGLEGTKWENYRLRGSQIDFVDSTGRPTILANGQIEAPFQTQSSCITCHARAAMNRQGQTTEFAIPVGVPDPNWFRDPQTGERQFMQLDFLWSLDRAQRRSP